MSLADDDRLIGTRSRISAAMTGMIRERWGIAAEVDLGPPRDASFGDVSSQIALSIAGQLGLPPRDIADDMVAALREQSPSLGLAEVSVGGPGFVNLRFSDEYLEDFLGLLDARGLCGCLPDVGRGRRAMVEFVSSNPTGPLTVGHCRQAVLGDTIASLLRHVGWKVDREYYYNDSGRQIERLAHSLASRYSDIVSDGSTPFPEDGYQGGYIESWAGDLACRTRCFRWPDDAAEFASFALERAMAMIEQDLDRLGIRFDRFFRETELIPEKTERAIASMREVATPDGPLAYDDSEGKTWIRLTALDRPEDRVVRRADGRYTYRLPDIAYHLDKLQRGYDLLVDVFGSDHLDTSRDVVACVRRLAGPGEVDRKLRVVIHQFVTLMEGGRKVRMSTRAASYVTLGELIDLAGSADVTRYLFLTRRAEAHMDFDLDLARKQSDENPVYYVQYAHARISGILRNAREEGIGLPSAPGSVRGLLRHPRERELMRLLQECPFQVEAAAAALEPHRLTELMAEIASAFHGFYHSVRVLQAEEGSDTASARLLLTSATGKVLRDLLGMVRVEAPERM
ncbi:arginine--tRNA ligase [Candidatus Fermentibacterales bacterium]|nr:arginine--tRNA ligase [Candidatus Fermentibacterales bacterium]